MHLPDEFLRQLAVARKLLSEKKFSESERQYLEMLETGLAPEGVQQELFHLYMRQGDLDKAIWSLEALSQLNPEEPDYYLELISVARKAGMTDACISAYERYLARWPDKADSQFNLAWLLRQRGYLEAALARYQQALDRGVSGREEAYTNMAAICSELRREQEAEQLLRRALAVNEEYIPALFNLAGLLEERGERDQAQRLFKKILVLDPAYSAAACRLAHLDRIKADDPLFERLRNMLEVAGLSALEKEEIHFALGKMLDDCAQYDQAFVEYSIGNSYGEERLGRYDAEKMESDIDLIRRSYASSPPLVTSVADSPIFICGMFRSGSTLLEQMLSGHSELLAGGEIEYIPESIEELGKRFPVGAAVYDEFELQKLAQGYRQVKEQRFGCSKGVLDKRPDNFLYLGFIKQLFPNARFLWTRRAPEDNCLSVFFQQLGSGMQYSTRLGSIAHYYLQQERLMNHWEVLFPESVLRVQYEDLVSDSEAQVRKVLRFLSLPFEVDCLDFSAQKNHVKTASIWQVRDGLHTRSSGRYKHYEKYLLELQGVLGR